MGGGFDSFLGLGFRYISNIHLTQLFDPRNVKMLKTLACSEYIPSIKEKITTGC